MIESFGVRKERVAWWAGITSAVFSLSQGVTAVIWGRLSDTFGRKPTIVCGLTLAMTWSLLWGSSINLPMAIIARALSGACNGNVGIIRTMVAEMVPEKELQPRAFSIMPLVWNLGSIFGPSFGGFFAKPAENMPALFGHNELLIRFPFLLPNMVASILFLLGITTGILFLEETLETKRNRIDYGLLLGKKLTSAIQTVSRLKSKPKHFRQNSNHEEQSASLLHPTTPTTPSSVSSRPFDNTFPSKDNSKPPPPRPTISEVFTRQTTINLIAYTLLALHSVAYDQLLPIFMHHPKQVPDSRNTSLPFKFSGGFGLGSGRIGTIFTMYGLLGCFVQFLIFPPTARRFGVLNCFKGCAVAFPLICFATPYTALIQDSGAQQLAMFGIMVVKCFAVIFAFPCSIIMLTNSATSLRILGTLNGVAVSVSAVGRAMGPAAGGAALTWGLEEGYVIAPWWLLGFIACIGAVPIWFLVEMEGFSRSSEDSDDDEEEGLLETDEDEGEREMPRGDEAVFNENEEALDVVDGPSLNRIASKKSLGASSDAARSDGAPRPKRERRMSNPIGIRETVGPGGGRRLSNGLAASNMGQGTGGTSFA